MRKSLLPALMLLALTLPLAAQEEEDKRVQGEVKWSNKLAAGFSLTSGNSELLNLTAGLSINRNKMWVNEFDFKTDVDWRTDQGVKTYLKLTGMFRYGHSFTRKVYGFVGISALSDYSSLIDYNLYPNLGVGYWFFDTKKIKLMNELGSGYTYYVYHDQTVSQSFTLYYRFFVEWKVWENVTWSDSLRFRPSIPQWEDFLINNISTIKVLIRKDLSLLLTHKLSYDNIPAVGAEKMDITFTTGLEWKF